MDFINSLVSLVGHIAWPLSTLLILIIIKKEVKTLFLAIARRVDDKNSTILITKDGLEIKSIIEAQDARISSIQAEQDQVNSLALKQLKSQSALKKESLNRNPLKEIDDHLRKLADVYMNIDIKDHSQRINAKNKAAEEMAFYIVSNNIDKDKLANENNEGLLIALADSIILSADINDANRLLKAAFCAKRLHVRYRVLLAITKLLEKGLLPSEYLKKAQSLLQEYAIGADAPLLRLISNVTSLIVASTYYARY